MNTSGFYKFENNNILYAPNFVTNVYYELTKENHSQFIYPVDGWYWFESENEATIFFENLKQDN